MPPKIRPASARSDPPATDTAAPAASPQTTTTSLTVALLAAREALLSRFRPLLAEHGLTAQQWRVIRLLHEHRILDASQLAERAFILPPSLTRILANLEARTLVTRLQPTSDRRRYLFCLTGEGEAIFRSVLPDSMKIYTELEDYFSRDQIALLLDLLHRLAKF
ncbi:transcriptional regulator [Gluconacetobacter sacchari DSM 12717]|uniref:Homoprotocatechuate degradation operon regulator HpaR n=2 Tax=Gluconacetobacter sacchari TaxID=92759 RepID=A0A7W4NRR8_9PROT|nr:homoprotocatechuate degradation operon regulator HpaR [Gluconacetobacter sacchari]MBB2160470.1 homoprotocatechuate degradation operon regulator HpaR [Gluconacetobacter sacchari]GBQ27807.1 transcriptional regulator [Gluconacetobacter sacchari DSM 12717]